MSIARISSPCNLTPAQAWEQGTNIRAAFKHQPGETHVALMKLLTETIVYLDYNKTITGTQNFIDAVDYLIKMFPAMKLEEWVVIMNRLKAGYYGKHYERLKLPELVEIFQQHEGERAEMMERNITRKKAEPFEPLSEEQRHIIKRLMKDLDLPEDDTDDKGRWKFIPHPNSTGDE